MDRGDDFVLLEVLGVPTAGGTCRGRSDFKGTSRALELFPDKDTFVVAYCSSFN
ncbi:MAG TPA: hypothetical protein VFH32_02130 [Rubrobacteraceae bacterium]|nr:hypothetical protein [Rubrobacteraceae bacterium]